MELSSEDVLKLNVLLATAQAIRIDEGALCVHGLNGTQQATVRLQPNCREDRYLRLVREMLASQALGSPRGYPVYLRRWTRLGELQSTRVQDLLMLGEEEAVVAAARSESVTEELARRIWWALPSADIARYLLQKPAVAGARIGIELAGFLLEFLPFETATADAMQSVDLLLQPGLLDEHQQAELWRLARRKTHYTVGFLQRLPLALPGPGNARGDYADIAEHLKNATTPLTGQLLQLLSAPGQTYLAACDRVMRKPVDQDVVVALLETIAAHLRPVRWNTVEFTDIAELQRQIENWLGEPGASPAAVAELRRRCPGLVPELRGMLLLAHAGEPLVRPVFARTDAIGSVMRRKIAPILDPLRAAIASLRGE